jgi:hypothetical protein
MFQSLTNEYPWVVVDKNTWEIVKEGSFSDLVGSTDGHLMTKAIRKQILEERGKL